MRMDKRFALAIAVATALAAGCSPTGSSTSTGNGAAGAVVIPAAPAPLARPAGTPTAQAAALAAATKPGGPHVLAGWLATYDALHIPVAGSSGAALGSTKVDGLEASWWQVWYAGVGTLRQSNLRLTDLARLLLLPTKNDPSAVSAALLADLRNDAASADPTRQLFAQFVAAKARDTVVGVDPLQSGVTPAQVGIDPATASLLVAQYARDAVMTALSGAKKTSSAASGQAAAGPESTAPVLLAEIGQAAGAGFDCSTFFGDGDTTKAIETALSTYFNGATIPLTGLKLPGIVDMIAGELGYSKEAIKGARDATSALNALLAALDLLIRIQSLDIQGFMDPDPLVRTKSSGTDGGPATIHLRFSSDPSKAVGSGALSSSFAGCLSKEILNLAGVSVKLPQQKDMKGIEIQTEAGQGFPGHGDYVIFTNANYPRQDTDQNGEIAIEVSGLHQKKTLPDSARPFPREFSIKLSAQVEATDLNSIMNTFLDGLKFGEKPGIPGAVKGLIDVLKTTTWDLPEQVLQLRDWFAGWKADGDFSGIHFTGEVCDLERPFTLQAESTQVGIKGTFKITPIPVTGMPSTSGTYDFTGTGGVFPGSPGQAPVTGHGTIHLQFPAADDPLFELKLDLDPGQWQVQAPVLGPVPFGPGGHLLGGGPPLELYPDPNVCV